MKRFSLIFAASLFLSAVSLPAAPLDAVFARIDTAAKTFSGVSADLSKTEHTEIVNDNSVQTGTIKLMRSKNGATRMRIDLKDPGAQSVALDGHQVRIYHPKTNTIEVIDITDKDKQGLVNQFLLLGFGATSAEIKTNYDVTFGADEKIGNKETSRITLVPKAAETKHSLKQADLWIGPDGLVVQQKFLYPSGDYKLVTYSNMKLSSSIPDKDLELKPKGAIEQKDQR